MWPITPMFAVVVNGKVVELVGATVPVDILVRVFLSSTLYLTGMIDCGFVPKFLIVTVISSEVDKVEHTGSTVDILPTSLLKTGISVKAPTLFTLSCPSKYSALCQKVASAKGSTVK